MKNQENHPQIMLQFIVYLASNGRSKKNPLRKQKFLPAAKRHGHGKLWVGIVVVLLLHQTIVSLVCLSFIFAMCVGILG